MEDNRLREVAGVLNSVIMTIKGPLTGVKEGISEVSCCIESEEVRDYIEEVEHEVRGLVRRVVAVEDLVDGFYHYVDHVVHPVEDIIGKADRAFEYTEEIVEAIHFICRGVGRVKGEIAELCDSETICLVIDEVKKQVDQIDIDKIVNELEGVYRQAAKIRADSRRETAYDDVCSTVDELKNLLSKGPNLVGKDLCRLSSLIEDARFMIGRMQRRVEEYVRFMLKVKVVILEMENVEATRFYFACKTADEILRISAGGPELVHANLAHIDKLAEDVRDVAGEQGGILGSYKGGAMELGNLYRKIRGTRDWGSVVESVPRWLPSSLQSEEVLNRIRGKDVDLTSDGRILVLHGAGDGGVTELMKVPGENGREQDGDE